MLHKVVLSVLMQMALHPQPFLQLWQQQRVWLLRWLCWPRLLLWLPVLLCLLLLLLPLLLLLWH